ncbi:cytochrome c biogenesis CcdA family protein [Acidovorax sp. RAC01]|mgnify:CR=1 FL=1|jgi:cytochrome c-type biogenesis protein|uniref:cytochrome c biogenesis CcdA family protein n=1 Tax=Acidovorax sp. RAC01 TaxID=1842533 RepID=UPI00083E82FC|nr:cytochrome c biogenesis CcdA family protein [Acidovorax sp. RAC01]AOG23633.1 cytochrome C biogenesis transmembrane region family protein [Acidovorax sp. RAC01]
MTSLWLAGAAGMLTVGAPCVLPMLPVVLSASVGAPAQRTRPLFIALGFALSFAALALVFSSFTQVLGISHEGLRQFAAVMLLLFGVLTVWPRPFQWLTLHASGALNRVANLGAGASAGNLGGLVLGLSLGAVWTPCAGPVLASILTLIATEPPGTRTALLLLAYSTGAALPMLAIAYGGQAAAGYVRRVSRHAHRVQQAFGVVVMAVALAMLFQVDGQITLYLSQLYPQGSSGL